MLKTLDDFSCEARPDLNREAVVAVFACSFVAGAANVVYVGGVQASSDLLPGEAMRGRST